MTKGQRLAAVPLLGAVILAGGAAAGYVGKVSADTATDTSITQSTATNAATDISNGADASALADAAVAADASISGTAPPGQRDPSQGGHIGANGVKEVRLTGSDATKATNAALAAVPGATVDRVETDAEGTAYEAHMTKADGSRVTVKFDSSFNVTSTEDGMR